MSVKRAQREIDAAEFAEWLAYYRLEPWGEERGDLRAGIVASTVANAWRGKDVLPFNPGDFMPEFGPPDAGPLDEEAAIAQQEALFEGFTRQFGGRVVDAA